MKCIHKCQELETSEDKAHIIPMLYAYEDIDEVVKFI